MGVGVGEGNSDRGVGKENLGEITKLSLSLYLATGMLFQCVS